MPGAPHGLVSEMNDFNTKIIEEFRANGGKMSGPFNGVPVVLVNTIGAKSGKTRTIPLAYLPDGDRIVIFASKGGAPTNPDWFHNLRAHPDITIEVGDETRDVTAVVVEGAERDALFARQVERMPGFGDYQANTDRVIPVIALVRR
jgi:deazaflavin-dependent oxidoreductase (nitroreductase family)